jgi:hypothetical protein
MSATRNDVHFRAPPSLSRALREAAQRRLSTPSEYARQAIIEKLRADGIDPAGDERKEARTA